MGGHDHGSGHDHEHGPSRIDRLNDPAQYRYLSAEELRRFLDPNPDWTVLDLGSGTGFYTDAVAPVVDTAYAVDVSPEMHEAYRDRGRPGNVESITADVADVPLEDAVADGALSLRTFHHGVSDALDEVARLLRPGGRFVVVDWSATGVGDRDRGPDPENCFDLATVQSMLVDEGFEIADAHERRETFVVVARVRA
jgi:ubiquinone/menaquinone biosynthesis C-methylase UbiE